MTTVTTTLRTVVSWTLRVLLFAAFFTRELIAANAVLTWDIITPASRLQPGIARFPLRCRTRFEIAFLANLISLTPGTLTVGVRRDPPVLYVHGMYAPDPELFRQRLRRLEDRMLAAVRFRGEDAARPEETPR